MPSHESPCCHRILRQLPNSRKRAFLSLFRTFQTKHLDVEQTIRKLRGTPPMPHPIFNIDELLRLVINELVETSQESAVSFALTCRSFEGPTLRLLWKEQSSLHDLVMVLPSATRIEGSNHRWSVEIEHDPSAEDWTRLQRYASWMRGLFLNDRGTIGVSTLLRLSRGSPNGLLFPKLEWLCWYLNVTGTSLPFFHLFLSPSLRRVTFAKSPGDPNLLPVHAAMLAQIILVLPTSLEDLDVECGEGINELLKDPLSSFLCQCAPSIRGFGACVPLSEAATLRLLQLPNLSRWRTGGEPPQTVSTPLLPSLKQFHLDEGEVIPWLHFLATRGKGGHLGVSASATSHADARDTLEAVFLPSFTVDSIFLSSITNLRNLVKLRLKTDCITFNRCVFRLTDDDVKTLAIALPRLQSLELGRACPRNTCNTTVVSLMSISIHCPDLILLQIHFNTKTIDHYMRHLLDGGVGRDKIKCKVQCLFAGGLPLQLESEEIQTVGMGLRVIFPHLTHLTSYQQCWYELRMHMGLQMNYEERYPFFP